MKYKLTIVLLVIITAIGACKKDNENDCVTGNGDIQQDTRYVGDFSSVSANGAYNITFAQTSNTQVDLFGDSNILPLIKTSVANNLLTIDTDASTCYSTNNTVEITLSSPLITSITLNGAGMIVGHGLNQDILKYTTNGAAVINSSFNVLNFESTSNGTGDANYAGTAEEATFVINGAGNIYAQTLTTDKSTITISGTGDVRITVNEELNVTITGAGNIYYYGEPGTINTNITGTGQLIKEG